MIENTDAASAEKKPATGVVLGSPEDIARELKSARRGTKMSCEELGALLGNAPSLISLREAGTRMPPTIALIRTFKLLGKKLVLVDDDAEQVEIPAT